MPRLIPFRLAAACALALVLLALRCAATRGRQGPEPTCASSARAARSSPNRRSRPARRGQDQPQGDLLRRRHRRQRRSRSRQRRDRAGPAGQAAKTTAALRPLLITDAFDFGLGICGVGGSIVQGKASWYLKVNHKGPQVGGDAAKLKAGDEVLWALAPSYPYPNELALEAPTDGDRRRAVHGPRLLLRRKRQAQAGRGAKVTGGRRADRRRRPTTVHADASRPR